MYDSFNDSIFTTFKKRGPVTNISHISTASEALAHIMLKQGYYFNVVISQLTKPKLTTVLRPIDPAEDPRIPVCFVTRNDCAGARHRVVQNFLLHAIATSRLQRAAAGSFAPSPVPTLTRRAFIPRRCARAQRLPL